jgi:hypothetical protein
MKQPDIIESLPGAEIRQKLSYKNQADMEMYFIIDRLDRIIVLLERIAMKDNHT